MNVIPRVIKNTVTMKPMFYISILKASILKFLKYFHIFIVINSASQLGALSLSRLRMLLRLGLTLSNTGTLRKHHHIATTLLRLRPHFSISPSNALDQLFFAGNRAGGSIRRFTKYMIKTNTFENLLIIGQVDCNWWALRHHRHRHIGHNFFQRVLASSLQISDKRVYLKSGRDAGKGHKIH